MNAGGWPECEFYKISLVILRSAVSVLFWGLNIQMN